MLWYIYLEIASHAISVQYYSAIISYNKQLSSNKLPGNEALSLLWGVKAEWDHFISQWRESVLCVCPLAGHACRVLTAMWVTSLLYIAEGRKLATRPARVRLFQKKLMQSSKNIISLDMIYRSLYFFDASVWFHNCMLCSITIFVTSAVVKVLLIQVAQLLLPGIALQLCLKMCHESTFKFLIINIYTRMQFIQECATKAHCFYFWTVEILRLMHRVVCFCQPEKMTWSMFVLYGTCLISSILILFPQREEIHLQNR